MSEASTEDREQAGRASLIAATEDVVRQAMSHWEGLRSGRPLHDGRSLYARLLRHGMAVAAVHAAENLAQRVGAWAMRRADERAAALERRVAELERRLEGMPSFRLEGRGGENGGG